MKMIGHAAYLDRLDLIILRNAGEERPNAVLHFGFDPWLAIFGAEDDVIMQARERIRHAAKMRVIGLRFKCRYATPLCSGALIRGLKPTATFKHGYAMSGKTSPFQTRPADQNVFCRPSG